MQGVQADSGTQSGMGRIALQPHPQVTKLLNTTYHVETPDTALPSADAAHS